MQKILILGAGLSASTCIKYLLDHSQEYQWKITLGDIDENLALQKIAGHQNGRAIHFDVLDDLQRNRLIADADLVISMLPARMHILVAESCLKNKRNLVTASYVSDEIRKLDQDARKQGVLLLNEIGVDPGIDHMSAMRLLDRIRADGGKVEVFESNTGGLVAPGSDNNPWKYKFTWNPRNVVLAGQKGARFLHNGNFKYIPYHKLFERYEIINILDLGKFEVYPNRDSLTYQDDYGLQDISTMFRGTIRRTGFCDAWNALVQLGATDDSYVVEFPGDMTHRDFTNSFLGYNIVDPVETKLSRYLKLDPEGEVMQKISWLGLFDPRKALVQDQTPAKVLQALLEEKLKLEEGDKDMIVMQHQIEYQLDTKNHRIVSSMAFIGENSTQTAMSITVGLPVAIACKLILQNKISLKGVQIPIHEEIYDPVMNELEGFGIRFTQE
ncbi:saccharopine dehydrogenase C-terminal domain-containing protein [Bacteroidota bacterium]